MPLGLAKDIIAKGAAAAPAAPMTDRGYWTSTGTTSTGANAATVICDRGTTYSNVGNITVSYWFRGSTSDLDSDEADILVARSNDNFAISIIMNKGASNHIKFTTANKPAGTQFTNNTNLTVTDFDTLYLNGNWHHVVGTLRSDTTTYIRQVYLDGVQLVNSSASGQTAHVAQNINRYWWCGSGPDNTPLSSYGIAPDAGGHKMDIANLAVWHSHIDLPTNITKFYNGGGIDLGTDGTASGLIQPQLIMRANVAGNMVGAAGSISNGGSLAWTIYGSREGTGNIEVFTTGGPT